uniref:Uncharacterized protein n=1 Tax=Zea mays TaxID=4577 RepID=B6U9W4_MAIZE|nr:hypothetical protein [Zea mays]
MSSPPRGQPATAAVPAVAAATSPQLPAASHTLPRAFLATSSPRAIVAAPAPPRRGRHGRWDRRRRREQFFSTDSDSRNLYIHTNTRANERPKGRETNGKRWCVLTPMHRIPGCSLVNHDAALLQLG